MKLIWLNLWDRLTARCYSDVTTSPDNVMSTNLLKLIKNDVKNYEKGWIFIKKGKKDSAEKMGWLHEAHTLWTHTLVHKKGTMASLKQS